MGRTPLSIAIKASLKKVTLLLLRAKASLKKTQAFDLTQIKCSPKIKKILNKAEKMHLMLNAADLSRVDQAWASLSQEHLVYTPKSSF